jgi:4-hydroxy-tetrahydrodipicolinate synthase
MSSASTPPPRHLERGVWGILATPFTDRDEVDVASLRRQIELLARSGARGVVALGVFGEAAQLDDHERRVVAREALTAANDRRMGVVIGIPTIERWETIVQAQIAVSIALEVSGRSALDPGGLLRGLMVQVPSSDGAVVAAHMTEIHEATGAGVVVQDYPRSSGVRIAADVLAHAVAALPFVVAIKAESAPTPPAVATLATVCTTPVFGGLGGVALIDELAAGAAGAMTGFSFPEGLAATVRASETGGTDAARAAWAPWLPLAVFEQQEGLALGIRKEILHRRGVLAHARVRPPAIPYPRALDPLLAGHLADAERRLARMDH